MTSLKEIESILPPQIIENIKNAFKEFKLSEAQKSVALERIIEIYNNTCFEPAEAIGVVAAQSISEPGTQMSLVPEETILIKEDEIVKPVQIGKFVDRIIDGSKIKRTEKTEICDLNKNSFVLSLDKNEKVCWKKIKSCIRHKLNGKLIKIKTRSGRKIIATDYHSFVTRKNNEVVPIAGKKLKIGDRLPVIKNIPLNCAMQVDLNQIISTENLVKKNGYLYPYIAHSRGLPINMELDSIFGWFVGAYLSEGNSTKYYVNISNTDKNFIKNLKNFAYKFNFTFNEFDNFRGFAKGHDLRINSSLLSLIMKDVFGKDSKNKKIADFVFNANEKFIGALLQSYFDGDGNINVERKMIRASSNSKQLIDGVALLLSRMGIFSTKSFNGKQYCITIPANYIPIFKEKIGSSIEKNKRKLKKISFEKNKTYDLLDIIPGISDLLYSLAKKLKMPTRFVNNFTKRQKIGRHTLGRYIEKFETMAKERGMNIDKELEIMKRAFDSDVVWDEIIDIKEVEPENEFVYDISVDGLETFTTFDGLITHNTMRTYHVAGATQIQVTLGLPRLIEIFDARRAPKTPSMTIYLQKAFNTADKAKKIATEIKETKLKDIAIQPVVDLLNMQIEIPFDKDKLKLVGIKPKVVVEILKSIIKDVNVLLKEMKVIIKPKTELTVKALQKLKTKILGTHLKGLKGIVQILILQEDSEWVIHTSGSNLAKILEIPGVDLTRVTTNNIHEVLKVLGVEAARRKIIEEADTVINKEEGLNVDIRHIMLVADVMTADGVIKAIGRYGVAGAKGSVLARANFEETIKHLTRSAAIGDTDKLESIVENVMINQVIPVGTGMFDLIFKLKK